MILEKICFDDIKQGDFITRIEISTYDGKPFAVSGTADRIDEKALEVYPGIFRYFWMSETRETLGWQDYEKGKPLPHFPEGYLTLLRVLK